jgi:hypothetical protein
MTTRFWYCVLVLLGAAVLLYAQRRYHRGREREERERLMESAERGQKKEARQFH